MSWPVAVLLSGLTFLIGHAAALYAQPRLSTHAVLGEIRERGAQWNTLSVSSARTAAGNIVVRDNPDTITAFAMIDSGKGELLFDMPVLQEPLYWSVSVYAADTDVVHLTRDRDAEGPVRLAFVRSAARVPEGYEHVDFTSSVLVLLVRAVVDDRSDSARVEAVRAELQRATLTALE